MRFADIIPFTRSANYQVSVEWKYLESTLENYDDKNTPGFVFDMDPDFQRGHVWNEEQQRRFVEFILRGGKSSRDIIFNCCGWQVDFRGPMVLVDGKQRLESARRFLRNELHVFGGHRFCDFEDSIRLVNASFNFHVNDLKTRAEVLQFYLDLNSGGTVYANEELTRVRELLAQATGGVAKS